MIAIRPPETLFELGTIEVKTYGVLLAAAILIGFWWAERRAKEKGLPATLAGDIFFWGVIGGIIGARLGFVIQNLGFFSQNPAQILALWMGGLSFHGALVGGIIGGSLVLWRQKALKQFWQWADVAAAPLLLGPIIGRLGNWANQELYGYPTDLPWGITINPTHRLPGYENFSTFHPTFAYEMILNIFGLMILILFIESKFKSQNSNLKMINQNSKLFTFNNTKFIHSGISFLFVLIWYSFARGITEIWRIGDRLIGPLSLAQAISLVIILGAIGALVLNWLKKSHKPVDGKG